MARAWMTDEIRIEKNQKEDFIWYIVAKVTNWISQICLNKENTFIVQNNSFVVSDEEIKIKSKCSFSPNTWHTFSNGQCFDPRIIPARISKAHLWCVSWIIGLVSANNFSTWGLNTSRNVSPKFLKRPWKQKWIKLNK